MFHGKPYFRAEIAYCGFDGTGFHAEHFVQQACAGRKVGDAGGKMPCGVDECIGGVVYGCGFVGRCEHKNVGKHVVVSHHACVAQRHVRGVYDELLSEKRGAVRALAVAAHGKKVVGKQLPDRKSVV